MKAGGPSASTYTACGVSIMHELLQEALDEGLFVLKCGLEQGMPCLCVILQERRQFLEL